MGKIILDASGAIFGRLCSFAAKKALEGNDVIVVNSEKAIISGNKKDIIKKYKDLRANMGSSLKGPKISRVSYKMLKKGIKGMLPEHRRGIGKAALLKVKCYNGIPEEFKNEKMIKSGKAKPIKFITMGELVKKL